MIGNLEPEEHVMEESVMYPGDMLGRLSIALEQLDWDSDDEIVVKIGGTQVSGIHQGENYNKKWAAPFGTRKYNKEAFIVIENLTRNPVKSSQPFGEGEFKPRHPHKKDET